MDYVAKKPVRFDRSYAAGELISPDVVNPNIVKRLIEAGRLQCVDSQEQGDEGDKQDKQDDLFGGGLDQSLAFIEDILGIDHGDDPPGLDDRAAICKERVSVLEAWAQSLSDCVDELEGEGDLSESPGSAEPPPFAKEGEDGDGETQPSLEENNGFECPVCKKVCGTKGALTVHMRTHNR